MANEKDIKGLSAFLSNKLRWSESQLEKYIEEYEASKQPSIGYEILEFKQNSNMADVWTKFNHGWCRNNNGQAVTAPYRTTEDILESALYRIHKVLRLSDKVEFCVGDKCSYGKVGNILKFNVSPNGEMLCDIQFCKLTSYQNAPLRAIDKVEQPVPLFTTEDGVKIFEGDWAYYVQDDNNWMVVSHSGITEKRPYPYFSTSEVANEWVIENKPCISLKDVYEIVRTINDNAYGNDSRSYLKSAFCNLAKSKIK